jgi:imidazolonepropionase-like amidohydrolase
VQEEFDKAIKQNVVNIVGAMKIAAKAHAEKITNEALDNLIKVKV